MKKKGKPQELDLNDNNPNVEHHKDDERSGLPGGQDEGFPHGSRGDNKKHGHGGLNADAGSRTNKK